MRFEVFILTLLFSILERDAELIKICLAKARIESKRKFDPTVTILDPR